MQEFLVPKGLRRFEHYILPALSLSRILDADWSVTPDPPDYQRCVTQVGEPICTCKRLLLVWDL